MQRIRDGILTTDDRDKLAEHLFIAKLACPLCSKPLHSLGDRDSQGELPRCWSCDFSVQPVLVNEKPDVDADESFWVVRLLLRGGVITPQQWQSIVEKQSLFVAPLCCPSCDRQLIYKDIHWKLGKISCCQLLIAPRLRIKKENTFSYQQWQPSIPGFHVGHLFIDIEVSTTEGAWQTQAELKRLNAIAYRQELMRFIPNDAHVKDVRDLQPPDPSPTAVDTPTETNTPLTDTADVTPPKKTQKMIEKEMITQFLSESVIESRGGITPRDVVYEKYQHWIRQQNREPVSKTLLFRQLREVFPLVWVGQNRINGGDLIRCFRGLKLHSNV